MSPVSVTWVLWWTHTYTHALMLSQQPQSWRSITELGTEPPPPASWMSSWLGGDLAAQAGDTLHGYGVYEGGITYVDIPQ